MSPAYQQKEKDIMEFIKVIISGKLHVESPIYRGNARKTMFTRDGDGGQRLVSLAGEINGTAQSLMDAFIGVSRDQRNIGLLNRMWLRLYGEPMPTNLITKVECRLRPECYPKDRFFDLRMGLKLDEDRGAAEAGANYKLETLFRNSIFDFGMAINDTILKSEDNSVCLYYLLKELQDGRFWFGAGKSKGLGRCRLEVDMSMLSSKQIPRISNSANHLIFDLSFSTENPVLVGWNWGKVDPAMPAFAAIDGRMLVGAMRQLPESVRQRLSMALSGPILNATDWKQKLTVFLPKAISAWFKDSAARKTMVWQLTKASINKLQKSKYPLPQKMADLLTPVLDKHFSSKEAAQQAIVENVGTAEEGKIKRIIALLENSQQVSTGLDEEKWQEFTKCFGVSAITMESMSQAMSVEQQFINLISRVCQPILPGMFLQVNQQIKLLESDVWVDTEIASREEHLHIKKLLLNGKITEDQWGNHRTVPPGVTSAAWQTFLGDHRNVQYRHIMNSVNLNKSIANDTNQIAFLKAYRAKTQQELAQPKHIDFRAGGTSNREISRDYGKPYDGVFMRMLSWSPTSKEDGRWEIYIPGSTIKGAFRKRAAQIFRTLWGESKKTNELLNWMFGIQGTRGALLFSDAYPKDQEFSQKVWCAMDGVSMDPKTGKPQEQAKADYLFAYGKNLVFQFRIDMMDIDEQMWEGLSMVGYLLQDFMLGDIPLGGEKTSGFGWVEGIIERIHWLAPSGDALGKKMFGEHATQSYGIWQSAVWQDTAVMQAVGKLPTMQPARKPLGLSRSSGQTAETSPSISQMQPPPRARDGFISHRSFGGHCGILHLEGEVLTPLHVRETGEPSFSVISQGQRINGWDSFSIVSPESSLRPEQRQYALPSKTLRGMIRHLYSIASGSDEPSIKIGQLNPADRLFGWVGNGPNQAIMGRLAFGFAEFHDSNLTWFKVPFPYGEWQYHQGQWQEIENGKITPTLFGGRWRLFPHVPLAPCVKQMDEFLPDSVQADYMRAIMPGSRCRFIIRFWNLEQDELERLLWCLTLEKQLAHKMGKTRQLGFGSIRLHLLPESHFIDWSARYSTKSDSSWRQPVVPGKFFNPKVIDHYSDLRQFLYAHSL